MSREQRLRLPEILVRERGYYLDFDLTEEQLQVKQLARGFAEEEISPHVYGVGRGSEISG